MISLPPMGCLPAAITLFGAGNKSCVERLNNDAIMFNTKLENTTRLLMNRHSGLRLVAFNVYQPFLDIITNPTDNGTHLQNLNPHSTLDHDRVSYSQEEEHRYLI